MGSRQHFDYVIIGAGQAGPPLADALSAAGKTVAIAERKHMGGSCVNFGCTPTKAALASARAAHLARNSSELGVHVSDVRLDFAAVLQRARDLASASRENLCQDVRDDTNQTLYEGHARLAGRSGDSFQVEVDGQAVTASQVVLNTGTRTRVPEIEGLNEVPYLDAGNWLHQDQLPESLIIIGGGYIGLEMAQFYSRMGSRVTILQRSNQLLPREDADVVAELQAVLQEEGVRVHCNASVSAVHPTGSGVKVACSGDSERQDFEASHIFVATGRQPNTDDLGLETVGLATDDKGLIRTDRRLATSVEGVWAAGDIRGGPMFTHTSWDDYRILHSQILDDGARTLERIVPYAVFTDPELARVGLAEKQADESGMDTNTLRYDFAQNGRARESGQTRGFVKVTVDANKRIVGAAVLGANAGELVHIYVDNMNSGTPFTDIRDSIYIHPTLAEALQSAVTA